MMNQEIKARWVAWLRANVDNRGTGLLNRDGKFCCLGGLCELAVADGVAVSEVGTGQAVGYMAPEDRLSRRYDVLPEVVFRWAGLEADNPSVNVDSSLDTRDGYDHEEGPVYAALTELNDEWKLNFNQIADIIEQQL